MSVWPNISLKSPWGRIELIPPSEDDDEAVAALRNDPIVTKYLGIFPNPMTATEWKIKREGNNKDPTLWNFHVHLASTPPDSHSTSFVGQSVIWHMDRVNRSGEIGILISSIQHRTGIATETLYLILSHAFEHPDLKLHRVQFLTAETNAQMRGWCERFGVVEEYRLREEWEDGEGGWMDAVGYSILEGEWIGVKERLKEWLDARV